MTRLAWSIALFFPLGAFAGDVYRSVDENGVVVYSDQPSADSELVTIAVSLASAPARQTSRPADDRADDDAPASSPLAAEIPRESTPEEIAADRARNCEYARQMQQTYSVSHRLYRTGPDGEREYLTDAELTAARTKAESDVAAWCD